MLVIYCRPLSLDQEEILLVSVSYFAFYLHLIKVLLFYSLHLSFHFILRKCNSYLVQAQGLVSSGEDSCSLAQHEAWLVSEPKKANPDRPQMLCRLQLTHTARAKDLCQMSPVEAMEKYPYLADKEWVRAFITYFMCHELSVKSFWRFLQIMWLLGCISMLQVDLNVRCKKLSLILLFACPKCSLVCVWYYY